MDQPLKHVFPPFVPGAHGRAGLRVVIIYWFGDKSSFFIWIHRYDKLIVDKSPVFKFVEKVFDLSIFLLVVNVWNLFLICCSPIVAGSWCITCCVHEVVNHGRNPHGTALLWRLRDTSNHGMWLSYQGGTFHTKHSRNQHDLRKMKTKYHPDLYISNFKDEDSHEFLW